MPSLAGTIAKLSSYRESSDPDLYSKEAGKALAPKIDGEKNPLHERIIAQIQAERDLCWRYVRPKIIEGGKRLKLYNNQLRDKEAVGDPLLFTTHQTVLAALYYDKLQVQAEPREEGDEDAAGNYNALCDFDYDEMDKARHDYEWDFDASLFGHGLSYFNEFDTKSKTPIPEVWDSLTFLRDPSATSPNGNRLGKGAMRFGGREIFTTKYDMQKNPEYFNLGKLRPAGKSDYNSLTAETDRARKTAQGLTDNGENSGENAEYCLLQWLTHINGKKYLCEAGNNISVLVRLSPLGDRWPLIGRQMYPMSHDWDGVSVADIVEDKQRFRSVLINILGSSAKADLYPMYLFNATANGISKHRDLSFGFHKFIPVNGPVNDGVVQPLRKATPSPQAQVVLDFLDLSTQKALATPDIRQGVPSKDRRTLGETQLQAAGVDTRYSLSARVWGWSEKEFWRRHYEMYIGDYKDGIYQKELSLTVLFGGASEFSFKKLGRSDFIARSPQGFDIKIESRELSEAKKLRNFQQISIYLASALTEPSADRVYALREQGKYILPKDKVERILPLSVDERIAKKENESLNENEPVEVRTEDNHLVHLRMHVAAKDTPSSRAHIKAHEDALVAKRMFPHLFPVMPEDMQSSAQQTLASQSPAMVNQQNQTPASNAVGSGTTEVPLA